MPSIAAATCQGTRANEFADEPDGAWVIRPPMPRRDFSDRASLEGQPHAGGGVVAVTRVALHDDPVQGLRLVHR